MKTSNRNTNLNFSDWVALICLGTFLLLFNYKSKAQSASVSNTIYRNSINQDFNDVTERFLYYFHNNLASSDLQNKTVTLGESIKPPRNKISKYNCNVFTNIDHPRELFTDKIISAGMIFYQGVVSPYNDNTWIYIERETLGSNFNLWVIDFISGHKSLLLNNNSAPDRRYAFKPISWALDSNKVYIEAFECWSPFEHEGVWELNISTKEFRKLSISSRIMNTPFISPLGKHFIYTATTDSIRNPMHGMADEIRCYDIERDKEFVLQEGDGIFKSIVGWTIENIDSGEMLKINEFDESDKKGMIINNRMMTPALKLPYSSGTSSCITRTILPPPGSGCTPTSGCSYPTTSHSQFAIDFGSLAINTNAIAAAAGTVVYANFGTPGNGNGWGNQVRVQHNDGTIALYAHLNSIGVKVGDVVSQGCILGKIGNTGLSTGVHLHFEVRDAAFATAFVTSFTECGCTPFPSYNCISGNTQQTCTSNFGLNCANPIPLTCNVPYNGSTLYSGPGGNSAVYNNGCNSWGDAGPERVHQITISGPGTITATLSNLASGLDLDVFILSSCNTNSCVGSVTSNSATYTAPSAGTYYILVDGYSGSYSGNSGYNGHYGSYTLTVACSGGCPPPSAPTICSTSIGTPANGLEHHSNLSCSAVAGVDGYSYDYSWDGINWVVDWYQTTSNTSFDVNNLDNPNASIHYRVRTYKCTPVQYSSYTYASPQPLYTACDNPAIPTVNGATINSVNITLNPESPVPNPLITTYSIYCTTTNQYVQSNGALGASAFYQSRSAWGTKTVTGLSSNTNYCFYAKAKNMQGDIRYDASNDDCAPTLNCNIMATSSSTNVTCNGLCNGTVSGGVTGGTGPYTYFWSGGLGFGQNKSNVCPGTYTVTVTDANACSSISTTTVTQPLPLSVSVTSTDATCARLCDGMLSANSIGGTGTYTYSWNGGLGLGQNQNSVCAGTYIVTVTDANNCTGTATAIVLQPQPLSVWATSTNVSCNSQCNGTLSALATGGLGSYTYFWSGGLGTGQYKSNVCAGSYIVTVTDGNNCSDTATTTINQPAPISVSISTTNASCNGVCDGSLIASTTGGTGPYLYLWSNGFSAGPNITNGCAGTYSVIVTDANNCTGTTSATISQPSVLIISPISTNTSCYGLCDGIVSAPITGGSAPYTYLWSGGLGTSASVSNVCPGIYTVTITDAYGCSSIATVTVAQPDSISLTTMVNSPTCPTCCDGSATVNAINGTPGYSYLWSNGQTATTANGLCNGIYTITVTDNNGCTSVTSVSFSVGINDIQTINNIIVYPNPTEGLLNINIGDGNKSDIEITLFNDLGQQILFKTMNVTDNSTQVQMDISNYPNGIYFLKVDSGSKNKTFKVHKM